MIYTFYSYKGGVGRSMALANLAEWFYMHGLRVVIVDWDLEAPGIENFFFDPDRESEQIRRVQNAPGVIDLLIRYQRRFPALPIPPWPKTLAAVIESILPAELPEPLARADVKQLVKVLEQLLAPSLLPAFDTLDTADALNILAKCLPPTLAGLSAGRDNVLNTLRKKLPATLTIRLEQVDTDSVLKAMEENWLATPPPLAPNGTESLPDEPDVSELLKIVRENLTPLPGISFDEAYVGPLLSLLQQSLPPQLQLATEETTPESDVEFAGVGLKVDMERTVRFEEKTLDTKRVMEVLREVLPKDFMFTLQHEYAQALLNALEDNLPPFSSMLFPIHEGRYSSNGDHPDQPDSTRSSDGERQPGLWLLSAGWRLEERFPIYAQNVQGFDWAEFYHSFQGEAYFEWMRNQLNRFADVVLIDSRTGVTEMGGVCTRQLADVVVSFVAPNGQNLTGVATMVDSFQRQEVGQARRKWEKTPTAVDGSPEVVVIPSRVETSEVNLRSEFEARFSREIDGPPDTFVKVNATYWDLKIPYVAYFSYNERIVMGIDVGGEGRSEELENAYKKVAVHLAILAPERSAIRKRFAKDLRDAFPNLLPGLTVLAYTPADYDNAKALCARLEGAGISVAEEMMTLPEGPEDGQQLLSLLDQGESLVIVTSLEGANSQAVRRRWRFARQQGKCVYLMGRNVATTPRLTPNYQPKTAEIFDIDLDWERLTENLRSLCRAPRVPQMAPVPPERFVAREADLARLKSMMLRVNLNSPPRSHADVALCGMGGIGKSALAAAFCYDEEVLNYFTGGVLWVNLGANPNIVDELKKVYTAVTGKLSAFDNADLIAGELANRLTGQNCLMVVDEVWDKQDLRLFIKAHGNSGLLITTRDQGLAADNTHQVIALGGIGALEAVEIVTSQLKSEPDEENYKDQLVPLVERLGSSPLALTLVGAELRRRVEQGDRIGNAIEYLKHALDVQGVAAFDRPGSTERNVSVAKSIALSLERLTEEERTLYTSLSDFEENEQVPLDVISSKWGLDLFRTEKLVQRLSYASLVRFNPEQKVVNLHPLLRAYLIEQAQRKPPTKEEGPKGETGNVQKAKNLLRGQGGTIKELYKLAMDLKREKQFGLARRLLIKIRKDPKLNDDKKQLLKVIQQHSLCTRKDLDLPLDERLKLAFEILKETGDDLNQTKDQETLGLAGAIFKNRWEFDGQKQHLERSLAYYLRGYKVGVTSDFGYTGINAAYVLDLLADQEAIEATAAGTSSDIANARRSEAENIRQEIVEKLPGLPYEKDAQKGEPQNYLLKEWWFLVTLAEAFFGLRRYDQALYWLKEAVALPNVPDWEYEATARQLVSIARLKDEISDTSDSGELRESKVWEVLRVFLKNDLDAVRSSFIGRVGLALSGGGFRASLFHIGVLAKLAELDVLRKVEVLSCVSGGSIIGAHYYLEVRRLLESKNDSDITREDYIEIVKQIEKDFLAGVQRNLRTRVAAHIVTNLKMMFLPNYSRTERIGELYEREIFSRATNKREPLYFNDLIVRPADGPSTFQPRTDNWRRASKVPALILNATTLNTGHNWQFTASWMGEPPSSINTEVDGNDRLRRMYYHQAPKPHNRIRLGHAVAASACVPGLFEPLALSSLYPEKTVRLVDGGVHDNQGIAGLLGEDCNLLLVSDASGQMGTLNNPGPGPFGVSLRSNSILMARVRESEYRELDARRASALLRGLMFIHLKKDLEVDPVDWIGCDNPYESFDDSHTAERRGTVTSYGVKKEIQQSLSAIRTDLDSFTDKEAYALMLSGYRMAGHEFADCIKGFPPPPDERPQWRFFGIEKAMDRVKGFEDAHLDLIKSLNIGSSRAFKVWKLEPLIPIAFLLACFALISGLLLVYIKSEGLQQVVSYLRQFLLGLLTRAGGFVARIADSISATLITPAGAAIATVIVIGFVILSWRAIQTIRRRKPLGQIFMGLLMASCGWLAAGLHLHVFDQLYLRQGRVDRK
jgi:predicted acylesterase/phospholipase RssA